MSIKDVSSAANLTAMPATRQETQNTVTEKDVGFAHSVEVNLSLEAMAQAKDQSSDFYTDPATASDAVSFQGFFQNATVSADDMADALHKALTSPTQNGDYTTNAMDLALTQAKLNQVVQKYVAVDYQNEASAFVAQFINEKISQADQMTKVVLTQATKLSQSLGDSDQAQHHLDALAQLSEGTHSSQTIRNEMLNLTACTTDSEVWFSSINNWVEENRSLPYIFEIEKGHISALQEQWQDFVAGLKTDA